MPSEYVILSYRWRNCETAVVTLAQHYIKHIQVIFVHGRCSLNGDVFPIKHETFVKHLHSVGPTSSTLVQHCTHVMQMFCVYRVTDCVCRYYTSEGTEHIHDLMGI